MAVDPDTTDPKFAEYAHPERLVTTDWLAEHLGDALGEMMSYFTALIERRRTDPAPGQRWAAAAEASDQDSYTVTKAAVGGLVRAAAVDLGRSGHLVNAVLRGIDRDGPGLTTAASNLPDWIAARWKATYGEEGLAGLALATREEYMDATLEPGMVLTVEPGLYFQEDDLLVPQELRGIGIRIEDDILVTADGSRNLSAALPRAADDVEEWMGRHIGG